MAHALVAQFDEYMNDLIRDLLVIEGHQVTVVTDCWDMLMMMRATLHPMVVIYSDILLLYGPFAEAEDTDEDYHAQERLWQMCERYIDDLRQHRFIETFTHWEQPPEEVQHLYERLGIVRIPMPFNPDELLARFNEAVAQLG